LTTHILKKSDVLTGTLGIFPLAGQYIRLFTVSHPTAKAGGFAAQMLNPKKIVQFSILVEYISEGKI